MANELQTEKYLEIGRFIRFFLGWRKVIIGGYVVIIWGAFKLLGKLTSGDYNNVLIGILLISVAGICWGLWLGEQRSRTLLDELNREGRDFEQDTDPNILRGGITAMESSGPNNNPKWVLKLHSVAHDVIAYFSITNFLWIGILIIIKEDFTTSSLNKLDLLFLLIPVAIYIAMFYVLDPLGRKAFLKKKKGWDNRELQEIVNYLETDVNRAVANVEVLKARIQNQSASDETETEEEPDG